MASEVPVLLLIFNRPEALRQVMAALREVAPTRLYVGADGPRMDRPGEREKTEAARAIAQAADWPCEVRTLFRDQNLGCRRAVSTAIDWFFEQVDCGIVLEDDCVPHPSYFPFAAELLERYRDDERVMAVAAKHHGAARAQMPHSYFFSRYNHCWGWASWRRAWRLYDRDMANWPELRDTNWLRGIGAGSRAFQRYWTRMFDLAHAGEIDSWAYRWTFSCWTQNGLSILPTRNLLSNIGFDADATHTQNGGLLEACFGQERIEFPLLHPSIMVRDVDADAWSDREVFGICKTPVKDLLRSVPGARSLANMLRQK